MGDASETVTLRTGKEVSKVVVRVVSISLETLMKTDPMSFYELVMVARDPEYQLFPGCGEVLESLELVNEGTMHGITRDIVLASTEGEGLELSLVNPLQP